MISFVIPAFNEEENIGDCIQSILMEASAIPHEIIVVDNGSIDSTATVAEQVGGMVIREPIKGVTRARQTGLLKSRYPLVAFIDADCRLPEGWLAYVLFEMVQGDVVAISGPQVYPELMILSRLMVMGFYMIGKLFHNFLPMVQGGNFVLRRDEFLRVGGFDTSINFYGEDTATARRLSKVGKVKFCFDMFNYASARRYKKEGILVTGGKYALNYLWVWMTGHPFNKKYKDIR